MQGPAPASLRLSSALAGYGWAKSLGSKPRSYASHPGQHQARFWPWGQVFTGGVGTEDQPLGLMW